MKQFKVQIPRHSFVKTIISIKFSKIFIRMIRQLTDLIGCHYQKEMISKC